MLSLVRSRAALSTLRHARPLCASADPDKIIRDIESSIATAKELIDSPPKSEGYSEADLQADAAKGTINALKIGELFKGDDDLKKSMIKMAGQINMQKATMATQKLPEIDWERYERTLAENGMDSSVVAALKTTFNEQEAKFTAEVNKAMEADMVNSNAEIAKQFDGPEGIAAQFKGVDAKLAKDRVGYLAQLEELLHESTNIDTLTIAEILEKNPEWQKAIEEDIKNHNWGSEPPAELVKKMEEASKA